ncbi:ferredoxin-type protein NapF [Shewanella schlegeliana]|uniref:Ferredoxin-type protein NapF n=1 Tax=Shewanella schlegeliana TaxID=190308 RepID=A0ABS1SWH8_9GAMM|nr:ferredoxin-type protein NapF [Shewanella schlegeliana]MBL4911661.1 ferredoxin-type protein NapF [Shewanella schlegeliana]MCL1111655.1 ferredoxin-type protein NapF [Shewanella schlegeliana]GIU36986.1 ferredoxin-type protein NapF [Shewanella schlegeliana]
MSSINQSRRRLFSRKKTDAVRPPWVKQTIEFTDECTRCDKCIPVCETQIIVKGEGGFPEIDFKIDECTFCQQCVNACPEAIFENTDITPWQIKATIQDSCMAYQGIWCQSCKDACDQRAISFSLAIGKAPLPKIDIEACTGCGACVAPCPSTAILVRHV